MCYVCYVDLRKRQENQQQQDQQKKKQQQEQQRHQEQQQHQEQHPTAVQHGPPVWQEQRLDTKSCPISTTGFVSAVHM